MVTRGYVVGNLCHLIKLTLHPSTEFELRTSMIKFLTLNQKGKLSQIPFY